MLNFSEYEILKESTIYYSSNLRNILSKMENPIAKDLLNIEKTDIGKDITLLDVPKDDVSKISYSRLVNYKKLFPENDDELESNIDKFNKGELRDIDTVINMLNTRDKRSDVSIGKLVNSLLGSKYTNKEVEQFVNLFRGDVSDGEFKIVEGEDIRTYYNAGFYYGFSHSLGKSCMRYSSCANFLDIYVMNPEVCKMLVLLKDGLVMGRALLWKIDSIDESKLNGKKYMDRIYSLSEAIDTKFIKWANKNDYMIYENLTDVKYKNVVYEVNMEVQLGDYVYEEYPYMDTFRKYEIDSQRLSNDTRGGRGILILDTTDGTTDAGMVYSDYEEQLIVEDTAIFSEVVNSWISNGVQHDGDWYPFDHEDIEYDKFLAEYEHHENMEYSKFGEYFFKKESKCEAVISLGDDIMNLKIETDIFSELDKDVYNLDDRISAYDYLRKYTNAEFIHNRLLMNRKYLRDFAVRLFKHKGEYYSAEDLHIMNVKPEGDSIEVDKIYYNMKYNLDDVLLFAKDRGFNKRVKEIEFFKNI